MILITNLKIKQLVTYLQDIQIQQTQFEFRTDIPLPLHKFQNLEVVQNEYNELTISHDDDQRNFHIQHLNL